MKENLNYLIKQFLCANGMKNIDNIDKIDVNSQVFMSEFNEWIEERKKIGKYYTSFIKDMELSFRDSYCAEVGKSVHDTIVECFDTTIITPNAKGLENLDEKRIINADFRVYGQTPVLIVNNSEGNNDLEEFPTNAVDTLMTQNPGTDESIFGWEQLHNSGDYNVILGIYGNKHDKDYDDKLKQLRVFRDKLTKGYRINYSTHQDKYFYTVSSNYKTLKRERNRY